MRPVTILPPRSPRDAGRRAAALVAWVGPSMRRRPLRAWLLVGLAALVMAAAADISYASIRHPAAAEPAHGHQPAALRVEFVGASITAGWYASSAREAYPQRVERILERHGHRVVLTVEARPGVLAGTVLTWSIPGRQDVVVVHVATNDYGHATPLADYAAEYDELVTRLRAQSPDAHLVCLGTWTAPGAVDHQGLAAASYDVVDRDACAAAHGVFVSLAPGFAKPAFHGPAGRRTPYGRSDVFHPNDAGQLWIAGAVAAALPAAPGRAAV